jgi:hypothetical protein
MNSTLANEIYYRALLQQQAYYASEQSSAPPRRIPLASIEALQLPGTPQDPKLTTFASSCYNSNTTMHHMSPTHGLQLSVPISAQRATPSRRAPSDREQFLLFVKILFKCLDRSDKNLRQKAKAIVSECTRRNRLGDSKYTPLSEAVERRLRLIVGEPYWSRAKAYTDYYCRKTGLKPTVAV